MRLQIAQPPLNTSLMGVIKGVSDFYDLNLSAPDLFGRTGHAFIMNINTGVCPSGPYVWRFDKFASLLENTGLEMKWHGYFDGESTAEARAELEQTLRDQLNQGRPCSMLNMDNQIISGYDETGFSCMQPWEIDFPPSRLTFGSWKEIAEEIHVSFFSYEDVEMLDPSFCIQRSLLFALDQIKGEPVEPLGDAVSGIEAYDAWVSMLEAGPLSEHGNWWNATVWSECRGMGARYFRGISEQYPGLFQAGELAGVFDDVADKLSMVSDRELEVSVKVKLLRESKALEQGAVQLIEDLVESIGN